NEDLWFTEFHEDQLGEVGVGDPQLELSNLSPTSGPASGGTPVTATMPVVLADATVIVGLRAASGLGYFGDQVAFTVPALAPGTLNDVVLTDPSDGSFGRIPRAWLADFLDIPQAHPFHGYVESLVRASVTAGCGGGNYCPSASVTRAQMAVFLLKAEH